jgi:hypothetical protein
MTRRYRVMHKFWLDLTKDDQDHLDEQINELKQARTFTQTVREGIRLICDLRQGNMTVLFELFPWIKADLLADVQPQETVGEKAIREQLERIEAQLAGQGIDFDTKAIQLVNRREASDAQDDDIQLAIKKDTSTNAADNFLNSMMALNS